MNRYTHLVFITTIAILCSEAFARVGETQSEVEARYGKPVSHEAHRDIDPDYEAHHALSAGERERNLQYERHDFPENFNKDGSRIDYLGEDAMVAADSRLVFFDPATSKWEDLRSNVIGRMPTNQDSEALRSLTANARKHLRQRFYILNGIGISVVYLGGRSVSEAYRQKERIFANDFVNELIKKSFPDAVFDEEENSQGYQRLIRLLSPESKELRGCATHFDGVLTITAYPYFGFLNAMEIGLKKNAENKQNKKLEGF
jgi:hypothetical protein